MKVIDLLDKIANNELEENTKIKMLGSNYVYKNGYLTVDTKIMKEFYISQRLLNDNVEIIEEKPKKIEECKSYEDFEGIDDYIEHLRDKINKLTKAVNYLLEKESDK